MERSKFTLLLVMLLSMAGLTVSAHDIEVENDDGVTIYYNYTNDTELSVTFRGEKYNTYSNEYTGTVVIPSSVTYENITYSVTSIGDRAFYSCTDLSSVTIPNSLTTIGKSAFYKCTGLTKVVVNDIAAWCRISFSSNPLYYAHHLYSDENTEITNLVIPNSVTSIGKSAFHGYTSLTSITIPNSVTNIGEFSFSGCTGLSSISIPNSVTTIGESAFQDCTGLTKVIVNDIAAWCRISFGDSAANPLYYAHHLYSDENTEITNLVIPNGVEAIGGFYGCYSLRAITIPKSVTRFGYNAFYDCVNLIAVTVQSEIPVSIIPYVFSNQENATLFVPEGCVQAYKAANFWQRFKTIMEIMPLTPAIEFADAKVKEICVTNWDIDADGELREYEASLVKDLGDTFKGNTTVTFFNEFRYFTGIKSIGNYAFSGSSSLTAITIPDSVTSIGNFAFTGCRGLTSLVVSEGNTNYDSRDNCNAVIETATNTLIVGCQNTIIANSVTGIGDNAFQGCTSLTSVTIPNSVTGIGSNAFEGCTNITNLNLNCGNVGNWFSDSKETIQTVTLGKNVKTIGEKAFCDFTALTSINIPNSVTSIEGSAFFGCSNIKSLSIDCETVSNWFSSSKDKVQTLTLGDNVKTIELDAFNGFSALKHISIGSNVTSIGANAFANCIKLEDVYCYAVRYPIVQISTFANSYLEYATLYVPESSVNIYKSHEVWGKFSKIMAINEKPVAEEVLLTYSLNGQGSMSATVKVGEMSLSITPSVGWKVDAITVNGVDKLNGYANGQLSLNIREDTQVKVSFSWADSEHLYTEDSISGIATIQGEGVKVYVKDGVIVVDGAAGKEVRLFSIGGAMITTVTPKPDAIGKFSVPAGIYIIQVGNEAAKVVVK